MPGNAASRGMCRHRRQGAGRNRRRDQSSLTGHFSSVETKAAGGIVSRRRSDSRGLRLTLLVRFRPFGIRGLRSLPGFGFALTLRFLLLLLCKVALAFRERVVGFRQVLLHRLNESVS